MTSPTLDQLSAALEIAAEQAGKKILVVGSMGELALGDDRPDFAIVLVATPLDLIMQAERFGLTERLERLIAEIPTKVYAHHDMPSIPEMTEISAKIAVEGREERESRPFHFRTKADRRKALRGNNK